MARSHPTEPSQRVAKPAGRLEPEALPGLEAPIEFDRAELLLFVGGTFGVGALVGLGLGLGK